MNLAETIRAAGIVGCGGAGFPTHVKYTGGQTETILVNGAECEPLLATHRYLMRHFAREIVSAAAALGRETGAKRCVIALKAAYTAERAALEAAIAEQAAPVALHLLESFFPAGDEQSLVFEVTGRVVPPGGIPLAVGCVVNNTATVLCIHHAMEGRPFTQKYLTVTGEVAAPCIVKAPVGTPVEACIALAGGTPLSDYAVVNGGPMMGRPMTREEAGHAYVTKTMSGLIVLPPDSPVVRRAQTQPEHMVNRARSACIQCSFCTQLCPRALLGHPLQPHRIMRRLAAGGLEALLDTPEGRSAALCCECGICEIYACPMGLQPRQVNAALKRSWPGIKSVTRERKPTVRRARSGPSGRHRRPGWPPGPGWRPTPGSPSTSCAGLRPNEWSSPCGRAPARRRRAWCEAESGWSWGSGSPPAPRGPWGRTSTRPSAAR